jgi:hypothetical protein
MDKDLGELVCVQVFYTVVFALLIFASRRRRRENMFYKAMAVICALLVIWFIYAYSDFGPRPDPGSVFAWGMLLMILPGIFVFVSLVIFVIGRMTSAWKK